MNISEEVPHCFCKHLHEATTAVSSPQQDSRQNCYTQKCFLFFFNKYKRIFLQTKGLLLLLLMCGRVSDMFAQGSFTFLTKIITQVGGYELNGVNRRGGCKRSEQLLWGKEGRRLVFMTELHTFYLIYDTSSSILDSFIFALLPVCQ